VSEELVSVVVTVELTFTLPADLAVREELYGTTDIGECMAIDLENDPASFMLENEMTVISVSEGAR
jgi:hypothetical protein